MIISNAAIRNRVTVGVLVFLICLAGAYSYSTLPRESAPDVPIPFVLITTPYEGVSPEDIETTVTMKIEKELTGIKGVKEITSTSAEGISLVKVEFMPDVLIDDALQYVRDKVDQAQAELPRDVESPVVTEINIAEFPIMIFNISGRISPVALKQIGDDIEEAIEQNVPGVLNVDVMGGREREIRIEMDPDRLALYNLTLPEIMRLVPSENVNISAGGLETPGTRFNVRVPAEFKTAKDIQNIEHIALATRADPQDPQTKRVIYLGDVATVSDTFKDRSSISRLNGDSAITVSIQKRVGANIIDIANGVKTVLAEAEKRVPQGVSFTMIEDRSREIELMVHDLENNIAAALALVIIVLVISVGMRASIVVALAVPLSMLMSFATLQIMGYTLNMIVLFSLVLSVGMLVDDAIVIVENIYRHMQMGKSRLKAAMGGTAEVAWPVITSTLTTCAAFFPLVFWPGVMGSFMKYLPITLIITLLSSLFVALVVSPVLCTLIPGKIRHREQGVFLGVYRRLLRLAVDYRVTTMLLCGLLLVGLGILYAKKGLGMEFFPDIDPKRAIVNVRTPQGTNIEQVDQQARIIEARLAEHARQAAAQHNLQQPDLKYLVTNVGAADDGGASAAFGGSAGGPNQANLQLVFPDYEERDRPSAQAIAEMRDYLRGVAGAEIKLEKEQGGPPTGAAVTVRLIGQDMKQLQALSDRTMKLISSVPGLVNLRSDLELTRPELVFNVDRNRAMVSGVNTSIVGNFLKTAVFGTEVGKFRQFNDEYDITVRLPQSKREDIRDLFRLQVPNENGQAVPLSSLGQFDYSGGMGTINRVDNMRVVTVTGDAEGRLSTEVLADVQEILSPSGRWRIKQQDVSDWPALMSQLRGDSPVARKLSARMDAKTAALARADANSFTEDQKEEFLYGLNLALSKDKESLYDESVASLPLSGQAKSLIKLSPEDRTPDQTLRLNRLVAEAALPALESSLSLNLPENYSVKYAGENEEMEKAKIFLRNAFVIALVLIVLIMVAQFNTLSVPFVIMTTVVLSFIGVLIGLLATDLPFGLIMTGIGVISLAGVVVKNGIVLMDYTRQLQRRGLNVVEACVEAGTVRLRPVLLTAACTVLGLVPVALGITFDIHTFEIVWKSEATLWWKSMAVAVIFGLSFATILTLVVVPCLYVMLYRMASRLGLGGIKKVDVQDETNPAVTAETLD